jgi:anti-anti-sigma regulatory factor
MPVKKSTTEQFIHIRYKREDFEDFNQFKKELEDMINSEVGERDVVVDFSESSGVASSEIGLLVRLINKFKGTARYLRIVGNEQITKTLLLTNIDKLGNLIIYKDQKEFDEQVKKTSKE